MRYLGNMVVHEEHVQCNNSISTLKCPKQDTIYAIDI